MRKAFLSLLLIAQTAFGGSPVIFQGSSTAQFLPTIAQSVLGNGFALVPSQAYFGDCSDGNVTISSGTTTLSRDMFYRNLTINGTGGISFQNQRVFVCGTLDITGAAAFALDGSGISGSAGANGGGAGNGGNADAAGTNIAGRNGGNGGAGTTGNGAEGAVGVGANVLTNGGGGSGGAGGNGGTGTGGVSRPAIAITNFPMRDITTWYLPQTGAGSAIFVAASGAGGSGGGGDGAVAGGGGGGGGSSGNTVYLAANIIKTSASTVAGTISAWGGSGGAGGSPASGNAGGGGGGGGGSGGWVVIKFNQRIGPSITNLVLTPAGVFGSAGGTGHGTGANGSNGNGTSPGAGLIQILNLSTGLLTSTTSGGANL